MQIPFLDLKRQRAVDPSVIQRVFESGRYIGGTEVASFEDEFASYCGASECVAVGNGTDALEIALRAANIRAGDEVATVANAGMYSTTAIRAIGATPLYVEIASDLLISPEALSSAIGPSTRAIIVTHLYGRMARLPEILSIARIHGIPVIEDCAQAHGAMLEGRRAGGWGLAGCFSFYPTKNLGACGDAGAIVTSDKAIAARARCLREYGWTERFHSTVAGGRNSRMDEMQAAILRTRLPLLDKYNQRRRAIAALYSDTLAGSALFRQLPDVPEHFVAHLYVLCCDHRDELRSWLAARGVATDIHYPVPDYMQPSQAGLVYRVGRLDFTRNCAREIISLPCFPELEDSEAAYVLNCMMEWQG
jgi:aminotransferase EvaB